jgi:2-haloacid dehalogenase
LVSLWRTRQFEYTWLRSLTGHYVDFWQVTEDALNFAAKSLAIDLTVETRRQIMNGYLDLHCWPEVPRGLRTVKDAGIRLALLSNMTPKMLEAGVRNSGLTGVFEHLLSTDRVGIYKPAPRAYEMGTQALGPTRDEILFAAFGGWDASGAKAFGYPTYWVNRKRQTREVTPATGLVPRTGQPSCLTQRTTRPTRQT